MPASGVALRVLVVEDRPEHMQLIKDYLRPFECAVLPASTGLDGLRLARQEKPSLVILDQQLGDITGDKMIVELRSDRVTANTPILVFTAHSTAALVLEIGADDYVNKAEGVDIFRARVRKLLERASRVARDRCYLTIQAIHDRRISFRASGSVDLVAFTHGLADLEAAVFSRLANNELGSREWRFNVSQNSGRKVYDAVFGHKELLSSYHFLRGWVQNNGERLHLRFECNRVELGVPFELMSDPEANQGQQWLVLEHPLARCIAGVTRITPPLSARFLRECKRSDTLNILLIASNTIPAIPGVDREIEWLQANLVQIFGSVGVRAYVDCLPTTAADIESVRKKLRDCQFHIVHYAGHGSFLKEDTDRSALSFWAGTAKSGRPVPLISTELEELLTRSSTRFVYLSCCYGTAGGGAADLHDHDFTGIADAITRAGVPSVLGFRRPVSDTGAVEFAKSFYTALGREQDIDLAVLRARREVHGRMPDDTAWLSPILIQQS